MKYILPDGSVTLIREQSSFEFVKAAIELEENQIEFAPLLGLEREFYNVQDLVSYISKKFEIPITSLSIESISNNNLKLKVYGKVAGNISIKVSK